MNKGDNVVHKYMGKGTYVGVIDEEYCFGLFPHLNEVPIQIRKCNITKYEPALTFKDLKPGDIYRQGKNIFVKSQYEVKIGIWIMNSVSLTNFDNGGAGRPCHTNDDELVEMIGEWDKSK